MDINKFQPEHITATARNRSFFCYVSC